MIEQIRKTLSERENEEFFIKRLNLYHPNYTLFGPNFYIGSLLIICNKQYSDAADTSRDFFHGPYHEENTVDWEKEIDKFVLSAYAKKRNVNKGNDQMKVLLIEYRYQDNGYHLKGIVNSKYVKQHFPYIIEPTISLIEDKFTNDLEQKDGSNVEKGIQMILK